MRLLGRGLQLCLFTLILATAAHAVMSGYDSPPSTASNQPAYNVGMEAFKRGDWQGVIDSMSQAIKRRPWHDDAYNAMGYAYRQMGNYPAALAAYDKALELNPHHRGALEYLGETYLLMGCRAKAQTLLTTLATACQRVSNQAGKRWQETCEEWLDLKAAIDASPQQTGPDCPQD
jgi:Flp pilus assembly protein TadD